MRILRSIYRSALLLALLVAACLDGQARKLFLGLRPGPQGAVWVHGWCRIIVRAMGLAVTVDGPLPEAGPGFLAVVSNHLSYLDILLYSSIRPFVMVAKSEVRAWPLIGWITAQAGTIYVQRADVKGGRTQTHAQVNAAMAGAFRSGLPVLFFPEGTTTDGGAILPFRRGLFHSVLHDHVPVRTATLAYSLDHPNPGACVASEVCFWGEMVFAPHLFLCLGLRGLHARVLFGPRAIPGEDRFALSQNARAGILDHYLDLTRQNPVPDPVPDGLRGVTA